MRKSSSVYPCVHYIIIWLRFAFFCGIALNSDQGCQFTSNAYKTLLKELRIRQSMDGKSRWADNVMIERWFRSLKTEEIYLNEYPNPRALRKAISVYIQQYNTERPHQALEYKTPESVYPHHGRRTLILFCYPNY